jgi:hypothetical protein
VLATTEFSRATSVTRVGSAGEAVRRQTIPPWRRGFPVDSLFSIRSVFVSCSFASPDPIFACHLLWTGAAGSFAHVIDQKEFELLSPVACEWAKAQEQFILAHGTPLGPRHLADARRAGVQDPERVRVLVVNRIPLPEDEALAQAAQQTQIITNACRGIAIGYGIIIRADCWQNREVVVHQLAHVAQCERSGGLETFVHEYLSERRGASFSVGALEDEARRIAREICTAQPTAT